MIGSGVSTDSMMAASFGIIDSIISTTSTTLTTSSLSSTSAFHGGGVGAGVLGRVGVRAACSLHIRVRTSAVFGDEAVDGNSFPARAHSLLPSSLYVDHSVAAATLCQLPQLRCRLPARLKLVRFPAHSPLPSAALPSMSLSPKAPFPRSGRVLCC